MNVRNVNNAGQDQNTLKTLQILDEISKGESLSQRDLSNKLDLGLGLVNSYIKNLVAKGYLRVSNISKKNYKYFLTPQGVTEKTRLAYDLLRDYNRIFREARTGFRDLFKSLQAGGAKSVIFAGIDEAAEIAYLSLQEFDLELAGVVDIAGQNGRMFFKQAVRPVEQIRELTADCVIITSVQTRDEVYQKLMQEGIPRENIRTLFPLGKN